jgi:hypothetical protein
VIGSFGRRPRKSALQQILYLSDELRCGIVSPTKSLASTDPTYCLCPNRVLEDNTKQLRFMERWVRVYSFKGCVMKNDGLAPFNHVAPEVLSDLWQRPKKHAVVLSGGGHKLGTRRRSQLSERTRRLLARHLPLAQA